MEPIKINNTKALLEVENANINGSKFKDVNLSELNLENVCMSRAIIDDANMTGMVIKNANLSDLEIDGAQLGGAYIHNIGMPPEGHPHYDAAAKQRPLRFEDCDLGGSEIKNSDLSMVEINNCKLDGMKINGILVQDLLEQYEKSNL
jgi:uncharacterized protein YjbI with pentapeptide repeats